jgi:hypothetical protein
MWRFLGYKEEEKKKEEEHQEENLERNTYEQNAHHPNNHNHNHQGMPHQSMYMYQPPMYPYPGMYQGPPKIIQNIQSNSEDEEEENTRAREETDLDLNMLKYIEEDESQCRDLFLKTHSIEDIIHKDNFIDVIPPFPKTLNIENEIEFMELRSWFYNTTDLLNIWHIHNKKPKLDYVNAMKYFSFKLKEIILYYYDYRIDYNDLNERIHRGDKVIGEKVDGKYIKSKLFYFKNSAQEHIQLLLDDYPTRYNRVIPEDEKDFFLDHKKCLCCKKKKFDEITSIKYSIDKMQLTEDQYNIFKNEYIHKLRYLERRKKKFKKVFCLSNSSLQLGSVILPTLITIKDNINIHDIEGLKKTLDVSAIILSVIMGIITNLTVFFKVNQRYSLYTQYDNKLKQEMRRFITYSEKYNDNDVKDTYRLFPQFSSAIENYIEELSNQEYDYIVGNKEKDANAFEKKEEIHNRGNVNREIFISDKPKRKKNDREKQYKPSNTPRYIKKRSDEKSTDDEDKISEDKSCDEDEEEEEGGVVVKCTETKKRATEEEKTPIKKEGEK